MEVAPLPATIRDQDRGTELLAVTWIFTVLAIIFVSLKLFTRARILKDLGLDDFFIFLSLVLIIICTSLFSYDVHLGMGRHAQTLEPMRLSKTVKINFIANPFGIMAYSFPNISVAILLNRILAANKMRELALYALAISQCVIAGVSCILLFAQCTPAEHLWNPLIPANCLSTSVITGYSYFVGSYSAVTDIVLAVVPIAAFWNLKMKLKTKIGLCILMSLTLLAAVCAIVKTTKLYQLADLADFTYGTVDLIIWAVVEANVIIMAACVPTLRPFIKSFSKENKISEGRSWFRDHSYFSFDTGKSLFRSDHSQSGHESATDRASKDSGHELPHDLGNGKGIGRTIEIRQESQMV